VKLLQRELQSVLEYRGAARTMHREGWGTLPLSQLVRFYPRWRRSLQQPVDVLDDPIPWMPFAAIRFIETLLTQDTKIFEYGAGGSSLFFASRVQKVVSVEHDADWARRVSAVAQDRMLTNLEVMHVAPQADAGARERDPADLNSYASTDISFREHSFRNYAASIDRFPTGFFQLIVIDGRARPSCGGHAMPKVGSGGWLILDNAERNEYRRIHEALAGPEWRKTQFSGPAPYTREFWQTCFWQRQ
jgi:hypothetical protein